MGRVTNKSLYGISTWTAPAGVFSVTVTPVYNWENNYLLNGVPSGTESGLGSFGGESVLALAENGAMWAWGFNSNGQLGLGDTTPRSSPVAVLGGLSFSSIYSAAGSWTFGLTTSGSLFAWGAGGNLGLGDTLPRSSPVAVLGGLTFSQVYLNNNNVNALTSSGLAYAWGGSNTNGELGIGSTSSVSSPNAVVGGINFCQLFPAGTATFGLTASGQLYSWGINQFGQLGVGDTNSRSSPTAVLGGLTYSQVFVATHAIPNTSVFGLTTTGQLYSWGVNTSGQLGLGDVVSRSSPVAVLGGLKFSQIVLGGDPNTSKTGNSIFGLTTNGTLYSWGANSTGQLGNGAPTGFTNSACSSPLAVLGGLKFSKIINDAGLEAGYGGATFALTPTGKLYAWGSPGVMLGVNSTSAQSSPVAVVGNLTFSQVIYNTTNQYTLGITQNGQLFSWGTNNHGQLAVGDAVDRSSPTAVVGGLTFSRVFQAHTGASSAYGITTSGQMYAWGFNGNGEGGNGTSGVLSRFSSPVAVLGGVSLLQPYTPPNSNPITIPVTPNITYQVVIGATISTFNNIPIGSGPITKAIVTYEQ